MYRFWKAVADFAARKRDQHWKSGNLLCPHCKRWTSEVGGVADMKEVGVFATRVTCLNCFKQSDWDFDTAPAALLVSAVNDPATADH